MVNLFAILSILLLFIVITECGAKQDRRQNEIQGRRSNKYFKFQPRKEDHKAVALFRTSVEDLPCGKNTELPMQPSDMATESAEEISIQDPDLVSTEQPRPARPPPPTPPSNDYNNPGSEDSDSDSDEAIDLNVNIVITNMPLDDEFDDNSGNDNGGSEGSEEVQGFNIKTVYPQTIQPSTTLRTTRPERPSIPPKPARPTYPPKPVRPTYLPPPIKPARPERPNQYDNYEKSTEKNYDDDDSSNEEIDINVAVIVTEMPDDDDDDANTVADNYDDVITDSDGYPDNLAARVASNTIVGLVSFCTSFALTNYFFY